LHFLMLESHQKGEGGREFASKEQESGVGFGGKRGSGRLVRKKIK